MSIHDQPVAVIDVREPLDGENAIDLIRDGLNHGVRVILHDSDACFEPFAVSLQDESFVVTAERGARVGVFASIEAALTTGLTRRPTVRAAA